MPRFLGPKDIRFFQSINKEIIDWVIETDIILYKTVIIESNIEDIYGESVDRKFYAGIKFNCIINREDQTSFQTDFGQNMKQNIEIAMNRELLQQHNVIPTNGDILEWNNIYWEINNVEENQYLAGRKLLDWSYVCQAHSTNLSYLNIQERHQ